MPSHPPAACPPSELPLFGPFGCRRWPPCHLLTPPLPPPLPAQPCPAACPSFVAGRRSNRQSSHVMCMCVVADGPPMSLGHILSPSRAKSLPRFLMCSILNAESRVYMIVVIPTDIEYYQYISVPPFHDKIPQMSGTLGVDLAGGRRMGRRP